VYCLDTLVSKPVEVDFYFIVIAYLTSILTVIYIVEVIFGIVKRRNGKNE
jgi:hypothetical protein